MTKTSTKRLFILFAILIVMTGMLSCCKGNEAEDTSGEVELEYNSVEELKDKRIGILTGTIYDSVTKKTLPGLDYQYYSTISDLTAALTSNKIDAFAEDENIVKEAMRHNEGIGMIPEEVSSIDVGIIFAKNEHGEELLAKFNEFLAKKKESGVADEIYEKWADHDDSTTMIDYEALPATNGTITIVTSGMSFPFDFMLNNKIVGYETELIALFCEENGYGMKVMQTDFAAIISAVQSGRADMGTSGIGVTEERSEQVHFSDPTAVIKGFFAVRNNASTSTGFLDGIISSFEHTFIMEGRWKLFVDGIVTTLLITIMSLVFGTVFGFLAYRVARKNFNGVFAKVSDFVIWLVHGMPTVVMLMILYYIVFGSTSLSGFYVSVIGFSLAFACSMYGMLKAGEKAIDKGQAEAAFTLGYTRSQTFNRIILPQAAYHFMPSYKAGIVSLIKATSVVGYIAVQDITKVGDIIRSRTYEAFFPLVVIAIMYFVMAAILTAVVNRADLLVDPNKRNKQKILKGVKQHD